MDAPILYTRRQVAKLLGLHPNTISRLMASGRLPYRRLTYRVFFTQADVQAFIDSLANQPAPVHSPEHVSSL